MAFKLKIKVATRLVGVYEVTNDDDEDEYPAPGSDAPSSPQSVGKLEIYRDVSSDGCWYVYDEQTKYWWGWGTRPCAVDPVLRIKTDEYGKISKVAYKVAAEQWEPLTRVSPPAQVGLRYEVEIADADEGVANAVCRYVIIGGRAYKVCS